MKIFAISDLHLELYGSVMAMWLRVGDEFPPADVLILAGDIGKPSSPMLEELLVMLKQRYAYIVYVPGNHEYYEAKNFDRIAVLARLRQVCERTGVHLLEKNVLDLPGGIRVVGTTLWSAADHEVTKYLRDFELAFRNQFDYLGEFVDSYRWLQQQLREDSKDPDVKHTIVVTHHLPSPALIAPKYRGSPLNTGFVTDVFDELWTPKLRSWYCGHTHIASRHTSRDCLLVCNPLGYPDEEDCGTNLKIVDEIV